LRHPATWGREFEFGSLQRGVKSELDLRDGTPILRTSTMSSGASSPSAISKPTGTPPCGKPSTTGFSSRNCCSHAASWGACRSPIGKHGSTELLFGNLYPSPSRRVLTKKPFTRPVSRNPWVGGWKGTESPDNLPRVVNAGGNRKACARHVDLSEASSESRATPSARTRAIGSPTARKSWPA
jgi:hypothetical protein